MTSRAPLLSFIFAVLFHAFLAGLLFISLDKTIRLPSYTPPVPNKEIIDAVVINNQALQQEVARLEAIEAKKREHEQARLRELKRKETEAKEKRLKEEKLAQELLKKNEQLKQEAALQKREQKKQQEELKKIEDQKQKALVAKQRAEEEKREAELIKQKAARLAAGRQQAEEEAKQQRDIKAKQDQITRYAGLMRNKIHQHWRQPLGFELRGLVCEIAVNLMPTGDVIHAAVTKSSGNLEFDRAAELAVFKASPLPMPPDSAVAKEFRQFTLTFDPEAV